MNLKDNMDHQGKPEKSVSPRRRIIKRGQRREDRRGGGEEKQKSLWGPVDYECNGGFSAAGFKRLDLEDGCDVI